MRADVDVATLPAKGCVTVGGYDVSKEGRTVIAYPIYGQNARGLYIVTERLPEEIYLIMVPSGDECHGEYVVGAFYSEAYATEFAKAQPKARVRSMRTNDGEMIEWGFYQKGPMPKKPKTRKREKTNG